MFSKLISILCFGLLFALIPLCIALAGILDGYVHFHEIRDCGRKVFFNPFFYDTVFYKGYGGWYFLVAGIMTGFLVFYPPFLASFFRLFYLLIVLISFIFFIPSIGLKAGQWLFQNPNQTVTLITGQQLQLNVLYAGREGLHFLSPDKEFPSLYRWEAIKGGEQQRCYRVDDKPKIPELPSTTGASPEEAAAVGIEPLPQKKSMFEVLMKRLFPD